MELASFIAVVLVCLIVVVVLAVWDFKARSAVRKGVRARSYTPPAQLDDEL